MFTCNNRRQKTFDSVHFIQILYLEKLGCLTLQHNKSEKAETKEKGQQYNPIPMGREETFSKDTGANDE
jgi:hypothetical protein